MHRICRDLHLKFLIYVFLFGTIILRIEINFPIQDLSFFTHLHSTLLDNSCELIFYSMEP